MASKQHDASASGANMRSLVGTFTRGSMVVSIALGITALILILLSAGSLKLMAGDFPPGLIMLLAAGFVSSIVAGWFIERYQGQFAVLGVSMLTIAGIIWAIFEDGYVGKAFMVLLVVTAGFMALLGTYNLFIRKTQPRTQ